MASKQNDLMLNILENPHMNLGDFQSVGLSAENTSLEDENVYLNSTVITENPLFQNASGEFDKIKFHQKYVEAAQALQNMTIDKEGFKAVYSKYNIFAPIDQTDFNPQFELTKASNPDRLTRSMITLGQVGQREYTPSEIAQSQKVFNSDTGEWMDTPEDMFSFGKLFSDIGGFISDNFGSSKVLATYEEDVDINGKKRGEVGFNENLIEHFKGDYKLNDNGTYYYRTLKNGEDIYGKQLLHYSDILTREGSALNAVDFLDSDDIQKSAFGSFVKDASLIGAFFLPYVGPWVAGATIAQQAAGLGANLTKLALGVSGLGGNDNSTLNWIEGLVESTNPMETRSEHSQQENWTVENLLGMVGDVVGQLYQQRLLFKYAPVVFKGKWGISEKSQEALKTKLIGELEEKNKSLLGAGQDILRNQKIATELHANAVDEAARMVEEYMKSYYKSGEELSKLYMTMLTVNDIYGEAKEAGAEDFDASLITAGYAAMEYWLLSTDIGKWVLPELRAERLHNKAVVKALTKDTLESFKKLGQEATTSEAAKRTYVQKLLDFGKSIVKGEFASGFGKRASIKGGEGLLAGGFGSLFAGATAEALEESSEELLGDFSRALFNGLEQLRGKDARLKPFNNAFDRYAMSFLGGFIGGGVSSATFDFSQAKRDHNLSYNQAMQEVIYKARNNELDSLYKIINENVIGNNKLSARKTVQDEQGNVVWQQADGNDNQDFVIKQNLKRQLKLIQDTLDSHGGNLSDQSLLDAQTLRNIKYRALHQSVTAGRFIQNYNELLTELVTTVNELNSLNTPQSKAESGEGDQKDEKSPELEGKRKKLEERIKQLDEEIENITSGKLAPLFMTSALLESTPFISEPFMTSTFRYFAEKEAKTKFENIPESELKEYLIRYQEYLRTTKKDDLKLATQGYLSMQTLIGQNFEEAKKLAQDSITDPEIKDYLTQFTSTLSLFSQNLLQMDDDTWVEKLQEFSQQAQVGNQLISSLQLLRNTIVENNKLSEEKRDKMIQDAEESFASGIIDEDTKNNTINVAEQEYQQEIQNNKKQFDQQREQLITQGNLQAALTLADRILNLGYINGAIKNNILAQLESAKNTSNQLRVQLENEFNNGEADDEVLDLITSLLDNENILEEKINAIKNLPYTPILQNLDTFALSLNGGNVSKILEELGNIINSNRGSLSAFTLQGDVYKQLNEALRTIKLYIAALEGARVDTVDPFRVRVNSKGEALDKSNIWGINRTLNEIHSKSPKLENDPWVDLPEIEGEIADMMIADARSIEKLLITYKKLYNINEGQKLNVQTRVAIKASYLLYDRIKRLLANIDALKDFNTSELEKVIEGLSFLKDQTDKEKNQWNINLNQEQQIQLEKERITLEDALYDFFNKDNPGLATNVELLQKFLYDNFNLLDIRTELLSEGATDIDETSIIGYIASKAAIKSSDFYGQFKDILDGKIAPIISQELGVQLQLANILNGNVITAFTLAYREILKQKFEESDFEGRKNILKKYGEEDEVAALFATEIGKTYYPTHDSVPQFTNVTFIDGIPGSGKSAAVDALVVKFLQKYYSDKIDLSKAWVCHGGDFKDSTEFTLEFKNNIGLGKNSTNAFNRDSLMKKISSEAPARNENGTPFEIKEDDYKFENGQIVPSWKLNNLAEDEIPSIIIIDEAQQFTQFDLMLIDKFAREHGIPVVMSGDLQQSKAQGQLTIPTKIIQEINKELATRKQTIIPESQSFTMTIKLARNQVLHSLKLGTSMRTANSQKNANMAATLKALEELNGQINLHYFEDKSNIAGDIIVSPSDIDGICRLIDKIIPKLKAESVDEDGTRHEAEKINFAHKRNSKVVEALKANKKYSDRINFIEGTALGQEGNYWLFEPDYTLVDGNPKVDSEVFISDLHTGITRSKIAGIVISPETLNGGVITLSNIQDQETHEITYSPQAIEKYAKKRIEILNKVLENTEKIEYSSRNREQAKSNSSEEENKSENSSDDKKFEEELEKISQQNEEEETPIENEDLDEEIVKLVEKGVQKIPSKGLTTGTLYNTEIIDYYQRPVIVIDINGFKMPFYMSTGQGGKKTVQAGKWYPFWGINPDQEWITKLYEADINDFYGSSLLKSICDVLNSKYPIDLNSNPRINPQTGETIQWTDPDYNQMLDFINQSVGYGDRLHPNKTRDKINSLIQELHSKVGYVENTEENSEVQELLSELDVSSKEDAQSILNEADEIDNPDEGYDTVGLSIDDFTFYLFSNATFSLGTAEVDRENNTYKESSISYRIDGVNGLKNTRFSKIVGDLKQSELILSTIRKRLLNTIDKSQLEQKLSKYLFGGIPTYVRFAIKTSERTLDGVNDEHYGKLERDGIEEVPYARAQQNSNSESNYVNPRDLVAIIGTEESGDAIEIPLLTLNNPITILYSKIGEQYRFPELNTVYESTYYRVLSETGNWKVAQVEGLKSVVSYCRINTTQEASSNNIKPEFKAIINLIQMYLRTDRNIVFIPDQKWTPSNNLHNFGPQLHIHRGESYDNPDYVEEIRWISLDEIKKDPTLTTSKVLQLLDKSEQNIKLAQPKHPFILYTDAIEDHNGNTLTSANIVEEYMWQREDPKNRIQTIKLVYVLPPKFTLKEYINSLHRFMDIDTKSKVLGNQRTAYKILEALFKKDTEATKQLFLQAFGSDTGLDIYKKVLSEIGRLTKLNAREQIVELHKVQQWPAFNGIGLTTKVSLYRHLQHIIKQMVYPATVTIDGKIVLKGSGNMETEVFNTLNNLFERTGLSLFYQCRANKNLGEAINGIFAEVQTDEYGHIDDPNIQEKEFSIRNISSSTFFAEKEFNQILDYLVNRVQNWSKRGQLQSWDNIPYTGTWGGQNKDQLRTKYPRGYSGWGMQLPEVVDSKPSIAKSILDKLAVFGITTNIQPTSANDDSIELKQAIANEINSSVPFNRNGINYSPYLAIVLPNGELVITGDDTKWVRTTPAVIKFDNSPFESGQQYQFEAEMNDTTYNVIYNPLNKQAELNYILVTEGDYNLDSFYEEVTPEFVSQNLDRFKQLLDLISTTNDFEEDSRETARELSQTGNPEQIAEFLNDSFGIMNEIAEINVNDFDKEEFIDILEFEKEEDSTCPISINIQFV